MGSIPTVVKQFFGLPGVDTLTDQQQQKAKQKQDKLSTD